MGPAFGGNTVIQRGMYLGDPDGRTDTKLIQAGL